MDMVHLVIGRAGVILLAEGNPQRVRGLLGQEKRRLAKVIGSAPLHDYVIGQQEGELPIRKLRTTLMRLPRTLSGKDVNALDKRLKALTARPQMPKGAIPKNMRPPGRVPPVAALTFGRTPAGAGPARARLFAFRAAPGPAVGWSAAGGVDDDRAGEPVVQAATVLVHDQRGDDQGQQHSAQQRPEQPDPAAVVPVRRSGSG